MNTWESTGKTIEDAIAAGLKDRGLTLSDVDMNVLDEGAKGIFGIGARPAKIRFTEKDTPARRAESFLKEIAALMHMEISMTVNDDGETLHIDVQGDGQGTWIGYRGEVLDSLQYLTSLNVNKGRDDFRRVTLDTENYRAKRAQTLEQLAHRCAAKCVKSGRKVVLEPMNPYERRILHCALQDDPGVTTHSEGEEPNRRVVIVPR